MVSPLPTNFLSIMHFPPFFFFFFFPSFFIYLFFSFSLSLPLSLPSFLSLSFSFSFFFSAFFSLFAFFSISSPSCFPLYVKTMTTLTPSVHEEKKNFTAQRWSKYSSTNIVWASF